MGALLNQLGVPRQIPLLIIVDEQRCDTSTKLFGGEIVSVFPPIRGG